MQSLGRGNYDFLEERRFLRLLGSLRHVLVRRALLDLQALASRLEMFHVRSPALDAAELLGPSDQNKVLVNNVHNDALSSRFTSAELDAYSSDLYAGQFLLPSPENAGRPPRTQFKACLNSVHHPRPNAPSSHKQDLRRLINRENARVKNEMIDGPVLNIQPIVSTVSLELNSLPLSSLTLRLVQLQPIPPGDPRQSHIVRSREIDSKVRLLLQNPPGQLSIDHNIPMLSLLHCLLIDQPIDCWVLKGRIAKVFKRDVSIFRDSPEEYACGDVPQFEAFRQLSGISGLSSSVKAADGDYHASATGRAS